MVGRRELSLYLNHLIFIVPMLQRGNASSDASASQNAERSSMSSHGDRGNYKALGMKARLG